MRRLLDTVPQQSPAANATYPHGGGDGASDFDTNLVIILAALLCALICAVGLNSIVRCALRCGRRATFETPEEAAARFAGTGTGLKKRALRQIPVAVYGPEADIPATDCPICLGEFADGEKVRVLPKCNHGFHVRCIDTWLASHSSCPTCRHSLLDRNGNRPSRRPSSDSSHDANRTAAVSRRASQDYQNVNRPVQAAAEGGGSAELLPREEASDRPVGRGTPGEPVS